MKTEYQIIAVDFDGTLCTDCFPKIGQPNTALIELLKGLRRQGRQIILWTCKSVRGSSGMVQEVGTGI